MWNTGQFDLADQAMDTPPPEKVEPGVSGRGSAQEGIIGWQRR